MPFEKDKFSSSTNKWKKILNKDKKKINNFIHNNISISAELLDQSKSNEINSSNYRIRINDDFFLLKKWKNVSDPKKLKNILSLMLWKNLDGLSLQIPVKFNNKKFYKKFENSYWSYFKYIEGNHFKGSIQELKSTAAKLGKFFFKLKNYPNIKSFKKFPSYYSNEDKKIINSLKYNFDVIEKYFSKKVSKKIKFYLPFIIEEFYIQNKIYKKINNNSKFLCHTDIHPHNIICKNNTFRTVIDLDSCKIAKINYAIAYAILKLIKQVIIFNKNKKNNFQFTEIFFKEFSKEFKLNKDFKKNIYHYAITEVLRRIIFTLKINIYNKDKRWNHIIPIQINHLEECKILFNDKRIIL